MRRPPLPPAQPLSANQLNFSGGPGVLPECVLAQAQQAIMALPDTGLSVLGMSHRSAWFEALLEEAEHNVRELLRVPAHFKVLFLQGGSSLQFSMIPMNLAPANRAPPAYVQSGYWSARSVLEARCVRPIELAWDGSAQQYSRLPDWSELALAADLPYTHFVSNETVEGLQWPVSSAPAGQTSIVDMSSDLFARPIDVSAYAMIYAHAQKNLGPAGVTLCLLDERLLEEIPAGLPPMLDYRTHVLHRSNYNTPPVFGIYVLTLVTRWLRDTVGGVAAMQRLNHAKAARIYGLLDGFSAQLNSPVEPRHRSMMNACFSFRQPGLDQRFLAAAEAAGLTGLAGHRSRGGLRVSMYNALSIAAVETLADFLSDFVQTQA